MTEKFEERTSPPKGRRRITQVLSLCTALGGCASTNGVVETKSQTTDTVNNRPEWVDGPNVYEADGYVYAVGSHKVRSARQMDLATNGAEVEATALLSEHLGTSTLKGARTIDSSIADNDDESGTIYVLMRIKK